MPSIRRSRCSVAFGNIFFDWLEILVRWLSPIGDDCVNDVVQQAKNLVVLDAWGKIDDDLDKGHQSNYERNPMFDEKIFHFFVF